MGSKKDNCFSRNEIGQVFTPEYIAEIIVSRVLYYSKILMSELVTQKVASLKILDPCVGQGVFLEKLIEKGVPSAAITAYELDTSLAPYLIQQFPEITFKFENFLGASLQERFDIIIGNPPYLGQNYNAELFQQYAREYDICRKYFTGNMDLFYYFIHLSIEKLKPGGLLSFITTNYWITKSEKTGITKLKPHILDTCYLLEYIDLSKLHVFKNAKGQHNCIFVLQKKSSEKNKTSKIIAKKNKANKSINIIQIKRKQDSFQFESIEEYNKHIIHKIIENKPSPYYTTYFSALTNEDLEPNNSWNLLLPKEIKKHIDHIENLCKKDNAITYLKDYFLIRNGLILISDDAFILKENEHIKHENGEILVKINSHYKKLNQNEKNRLKKLYKSSSIRAFGYNKEDFIGYVLFFNRNEKEKGKEKEQNDENKKKNNNEYEDENKDEDNPNNFSGFSQYLSQKYPHFIQYLQQHRSELRTKLINAKENPSDIFFPRRGDRIRIYGHKKRHLLDLEPFYEKSKKIFFPYISPTNKFGYTEDPYFATSDTYFLWPKKTAENLPYEFLLAYFNSKLVQFLFKAKNIKIKRSKTKIEKNLPIPNLDQFSSPKEKKIISIIEDLSTILMTWNEEDNPITEESQMEHSLIPIKSLINLDIIKKGAHFTFKEIKGMVDILFFKLFNLDRNEIMRLMTTYYS
ncbi:MAG: Modification methylase TaqI [Promethearchaeota archaeon]|nr:MAG: Modification methylase TaqI [Candidatus Lokiarchaeota archaeon]